MSGAPARREHVVLAVLVAALFVALGVRPHTDRGTWAGEVAPVAIALPLLVATYRRFRFTDLAYRLMAVHAVVKAKVPSAHEYLVSRGEPGNRWWFRAAMDIELARLTAENRELANELETLKRSRALALARRVRKLLGISWM